jgi:hypothetical protein
MAIHFNFSVCILLIPALSDGCQQLAIQPFSTKPVTSSWLEQDGKTSPYPTVRERERLID